jgi:hypothetical protein
MKRSPEGAIVLVLVVVLMVAPKLFIDLAPKPGFELWSVSDARL